MTLPSGGLLTLSQINAEFGRASNTGLGAYRGAAYWVDGNITQFAFSAGQINISDFYSKRATSPSNPGSWDQGTPGTYSFTIPFYGQYFRLQGWGAGGGGGCINIGGNGAGSGGLGLSAAGGNGGGRIWLANGNYDYSVDYGGAGGGASGGNENNVAGGTGQQPPAQPNGQFTTGGWAAGDGGAGAGGGAGGQGNRDLSIFNNGGNFFGNGGVWPGGGGGGGGNCGFGYMFVGAGGGGGGYVQGIWPPGQLGVGAVITVVVGAPGGGADGVGGSGAAGRVLLSWA